VFGSSFQEKYQHIRWEHNEKKFHLWAEGKTGFPIVDAGMRELNATGNMSGRLRMITASFLIKDLHIDWMWGEKYFAKHLIDYDPAVNNGNWQWVASTGCDAQPYFRIFNPWLQQAKFDPECLYIKKWIPELSSFSPKTIHRWYLQEETFFSYPLPMLDHQVEAKKAASYMGM
jgi:deoxyribodipyrimidine photo-lyase